VLIEERVLSVRRGITSAWRAALATLGYPEMVISLRKLRYRIGRPELSQGILPARKTPQLRDMAGDPHRNPTDETAHSGTLVVRVKKRREQPVSSVDSRELGCWSLSG
jgi:hypothetical protein